MLSLTDNYVDVTKDSNIRTKEISSKVEIPSDHGAWHQSKREIQ